MTDIMPPDWRQTVRPFENRAAEYDRWYTDNPLFAIELAALQAIETSLPRPRLEIGVGPGHFAQALAIDFGLDPAASPLHIAKNRGIIAINAIGEQLPLQTAAMGTVYLLFTLCFLADPAAVLSECRRILNQEGRLVAGFVPALSGWGKRLAGLAAENHPFYRHARLRTVARTVRLLHSSGFRVIESRSTLRQPPGRVPQPEKPVAGCPEDAGFCVLICSPDD